MANFDNSDPRNMSVSRATNVLIAIRSAYIQAKQARDLMDLYTANTDPIFNGAVNALYTAAERTELNTIRGKLATLVTDLETNHAKAVNYTNGGG